MNRQATQRTNEVSQSVSLDTTKLPIDKAALHNALHQASVMRTEEVTIRAAFRRVIEKHTPAVGVAHITRDSEGGWDLRPVHSTGRVPRRADFIEKFAEICNVAVASDNAQIVPFLGMQAICSPIVLSNGISEVLLVLVEEQNVHSGLFVVEIATAYFTLSLSSHKTQSNDWKLVSLAALVELVSQVEDCDGVVAGCRVVANELVRHLSATQVAVGFMRGGTLSVETLSGTASLDRASETYHSLEMAMSESLLREDVGVYPPREDDDSHLLIAHRQLASDLTAEAVLTHRLITPGGETIGCVLLSGSEDLIHSDRLANFVRASAPRLASALEVVSRAEPTRVGRALQFASDAAKTTRGMTWFLAALFLTALLAMPVRYRVRCNCTTEPTGRRFAVAPFDGQIEHGFVEPGDLVRKGQLLAKMDGQAIRMELASVLAEKGQAGKMREIELAARNVAGSMLSQLEAERLDAKRQLLDYRNGQIEIRSPIDGIVLSGSLERAEAAAVNLGDTVFEIGPLDELRVEIVIPAEEISFVQEGMPLRIWIDGMSGTSFPGQVQRIRPRSELREAKNVFVAEVTLKNEDDRLRPGMQGQVRIDCESYPLAWNIFHRPWDYLAARLTWW